jgi:hypothetical protein
MVFLMEKKELLVEIKEKTNAIIIKEFNADGAMLQYNSAGEVKGRYHGIHMETVDVKLKMDGSNEWEVKAIETTKEGDIIMMTGKGTGQQEKPMEGTIMGEVTCMTNSPRLSWLNNSKGSIEGMIDQKSGDINLRIYAAPIKEAAPQVAAPMM